MHALACRHITKHIHDYMCIYIHVYLYAHISVQHTCVHMCIYMHSHRFGDRTISRLIRRELATDSATDSAIVRDRSRDRSWGSWGRSWDRSRPIPRPFATDPWTDRNRSWDRYWDRNCFCSARSRFGRDRSLSPPIRRPLATFIAIYIPSYVRTFRTYIHSYVRTRTFLTYIHTYARPLSLSLSAISAQVHISHSHNRIPYFHMPQKRAFSGSGSAPAPAPRGGPPGSAPKVEQKICLVYFLKVLRLCFECFARDKQHTKTKHTLPGDPDLQQKDEEVHKGWQTQAAHPSPRSGCTSPHHHTTKNTNIKKTIFEMLAVGWVHPDPWGWVSPRSGPPATLPSSMARPTVGPFSTWIGTGPRAR